MPEGMKLALKPPETPAKAGRDAGQRMAPGGVEDHAAERDHQHVAGVGRGVADDGDQDQHRRQQHASA